VADINANRLVFTPAANASGAGYASFTFQVQDDGGTASGGVDLDASANSLTVNVTPVNDAPAATDNTLVTNEDAPLVLSTAILGFSDPDDAPSNGLLAMRISSLPASGILTLSGAAVAVGQLVPVADLVAGNLVFTPAPNANGAAYANFTFQVQDDGGIGSGGVDLSAPRILTLDVTSVNDPPVGTNGTVSPSGSPIVITASLFGFMDPADSPPNTFAGVTIGTLPAGGILTLSGTPIAAGQFISFADITAGNLLYTPNSSNPAYASFTFQVQDDGGGADLDVAERTLRIGTIGTVNPPALPDGGPTLASPAPTTSVDNAAPIALPVAAAQTFTPVFGPVKQTSAVTELDTIGSTSDSLDRTGFVSTGIQRLDLQSASREYREASGDRPRDALLALIGDGERPDATLVLASHQMVSMPRLSEVDAAGGELLGHLDELRESVREHGKAQASAVAVTAAASLGLSVGYVVWLLRGGVLVGSLLSSLPAWRFVDPLPVLGRLDDDEE
jgi:hypothetical protein